MMIVDAVAAVFVCYGTVRGRKRGLADEAYRLLRLVTAFAVGCGLHGLISSGMSTLLSLNRNLSAPAAFAGGMGGAWWILRLAKTRFAAWVGTRFESYARIGGAIAGALRTALLVLSVVATLNLAGWLPGHSALRYGSWVGRVAAWVVPTKAGEAGPTPVGDPGGNATAAQPRTADGGAGDE